MYACTAVLLNNNVPRQLVSSWSYFQHGERITGTLISVLMPTGQSDLSIGGLQMTSGHSGGGGKTNILHQKSEELHNACGHVDTKK